MSTFKLTTFLFTFTLCAVLSIGAVNAEDLPPVFGSYSNVTTGTNNGEQLYNWGNTSDHLIGLGGDDQLFGLEGNDKLEAGSGNDYLDGGDGDDVQLGGAGNDQLGGDAGNDWLSGGLGGDIYVFKQSSGQDTINNGSSDGVDWLIFTNGLTSDKLSYY